MVKPLYMREQKKTLVSIPDHERTVLSHLARDTLDTGFLVAQDKNIIVFLISEFRSFKHITFNICTDILGWVRGIDTFYCFRTNLVVFSLLVIINEIPSLEICIFFIFIK